MKRAVFLDRDGVLIEDVHLLTKPEQLRLLPGVPEALNRLCDAGFKLVVASNQTVVARGLATKKDVDQTNEHLRQMILKASGPALDAFYISPFHPNATLAEYRRDSECRKPRPGMLLRAATELGLDLRMSFMVGDRISDIIAGYKAGCRTILVETGKHADAPIESGEPMGLSIKPDHTCASLRDAAEWILKSA